MAARSHATTFLGNNVVTDALIGLQIIARSRNERYILCNCKCRDWFLISPVVFACLGKRALHIVKIKWWGGLKSADLMPESSPFYTYGGKVIGYSWHAPIPPQPYHLPSLENNSRRPKHLRQSKIPWEHVLLVKKLRTQYYSKSKLSIILKRDHSIKFMICMNDGTFTDASCPS